MNDPKAKSEAYNKVVQAYSEILDAKDQKVRRIC